MKQVTDLFGKEAAVELVILIGYYAMLCMTLNAFDVDVPKGAEKPFA
jgi:hypothetical protein